jgi:hypothetical protein
LPVGLHFDEALAGERLHELAVDEPHAFLELRLFVLCRRLERALEVVEHGQELLDEPLVGTRDQTLLVARNPLAVVLEVGRDALEIVQILVALAFDVGELLFELGVVGLSLVSHYDCLASSSITS